ncbi:PAS domain S-box protein [Dyadobacter sp. NIV53]|uniref:PAS domain S-box protein n=1 Tax=Dyadobacter sp. NIV53 TaxID=2861765 RepID=UPI001C888D24|nr:PAS domain S-box protein [Dyadobacter sp. NIV53]
MKFLPIPDNENERLKALQNYLILDTEGEEEFDKITELASLICDVPMSLISLIDENRQWFKSTKGIDVKETTREIAFCQYTIMDNVLMEVQDATKDERFVDNEFVINDPHVRFYAGYPLVDPNGYSLGTICVLDDKAKILNESQRKSLKVLASQTMALIVNQRKRNDLKNFETLFRLSNDLICIAGTDGYLKKINPAFNRLLGWDEETLMKTPFVEFIHPDDREKTLTEVARLLSGGDTANFSQRFLRKDGEYLQLQWVSTPEPATGNLFGIARNITKEKINEDKLRVSEEKFRSFFENSQGLMCTHDLDGRFLTVNSAGAVLLGYTKEEVSKLSLYDLIPARHHGAFKDYLTEIRETGRSSGLMTTMHKNGSYKIWSYHNILLKAEDGFDYVIGNSIDVTKSHQMAQNLQKMQEMLRQTNEVARVGGWEMDLVRSTIYWSEVTKQIHMVKPDYMPDLEAALSFYKEGESRQTLTEAVEKAIADGTSFDLELEMITPENKEIWVRAIGNAEFENGICKRLYGAFQDIDDKKRAELEIVNSRKLLNDVMDAASEVSIIATDKSGIITVFNKGAEKMLGYSSDEAIGKSGSGLIYVPEEIQLHSKKLTEKYGKPIEGFRALVHTAELESSEVGEWTYKKKNGTLFPVLVVVTTIRDFHNTITGYLGVATDLSARKNAEQALINEKARLSAFVQHAPAAVAMFDKEMKYLAVSNKWLEEYRLTGSNIIGLSHYTVFPNILPKWKEIHQKCLKGDIFTEEEEVWRPVGWEHDQYLKTEVRPWFYFDGTVGGIMIFTQDITEIILRRQELRHAQIQSEQASIAKSEFLANMSHEIRTPLNGVIGFTDLVLKTKLNDTQKQYLRIVNQSANALLGIINDILDFSKIEAGKLELDIDKCDIYGMVAQSTDIISFPIQNKGLEMLLNMPADLPRFIWVDEIRLKQVLINLLSNASKFTESGEIELKIEILKYNPAESNDISCRFSVRDTGIGIRSEKQDKIFEAFLQEDGSTTKKYGGTGLGLTISNKLLGMMGSQLQLKSIQGVGSTFYFDLTMKSEPGEAIVWANVDSIKKVLIVDDNDNNRTILNKMLQLLKIESDQVKNGREAINAISGDTVYDAVLMDYHMPEMDGLETIRVIRETLLKDTDELPVVLLNSSADDATVLKGCEELNVNYRLIKPIKLSDISLCLSRLSHKEKAEESFQDEETSEVSSKEFLVLIAEDNPVNMFLAKTIVKKIAPNSLIMEAENGAEAVNFYNNQLPDIVFMDIQMPEMNGYEATLAIRNLPGRRHVPIIALTAGNVKGEKDKCIEAGMDDFIAKPFVEDDIRQIFNKFLGLSETSVSNENDNRLSFPLNSHFDMNKLRDTYMDDYEFISEFLLLTSESLTKSLADLKKYQNDKDLSGIKSTGHRLKGATASAFLSDATDIADTLEHLQSYEPDYIAQLLFDLENEIKLLLPLLEGIKNN